MRRKKLKKTNEINRGNTKTRVLMCIFIALAIMVPIGLTLPRDADAQLFYTIQGYVTACGMPPDPGGAILTEHFYYIYIAGTFYITRNRVANKSTQWSFIAVGLT